MKPLPHLGLIVWALLAVWFLVYGVTGLSQRPVPGTLLAVLALVVGILLLVMVAGLTPL